MNPQMNQPAGQPMGQSQPMHNQPMNNQPMHQRRGSKMPWMVLAVVVVIVILVLGFLFRDKWMGKGATSEKLSGYQAVFLTNGQVYFGKLSHADSAYVTLKDIYYLQVNQSQQLQSGDQAQQQAAQAAAAQNPQLSLVKLGNELHGPADSMQINGSQILFIEDLKADGKVAQAIDQYKKTGPDTSAGAQAPAASGTTGTTQPAPASTQPTK